MRTSEPKAVAPLHLTSENFATIVGAENLPVLVDFWAEWCPPCRALLPTIDRLAGETQGHAIIGKVNVDEAPEIARDYRVQSIPTLIIFKNGREVDRMVGVYPKDEIARRLLNTRG